MLAWYFTSSCLCVLPQFSIQQRPVMTWLAGRERGLESSWDHQGKLTAICMTVEGAGRLTRETKIAFNSLNSVSSDLIHKLRL